MAIAIVLSYIFGERRRGDIEEAIDLMDAIDKLAHLKVFSFAIFPRPFKYWFYYVENTATKQAYIAPKNIENLIDREVLIPIECKNLTQMKRLLRKDKCKLNNRKPTVPELAKKGYS